MKERRHVDEAGSHRLIILGVVFVSGTVEYVEHFFSRLNVHRCDVLGYVLRCITCSYLAGVCAKDGRPLKDVGIFAIVVPVKLVSIASVMQGILIWLLKRKFASNQFTVSQVIDNEADGLAVTAIEGLF